MIEGFDQALLVHAQVGDIEIFDTGSDVFQQGVVDLVVHIADDDVAFGFSADGHRFGDEMARTDTAADQGGVEDDGLDKAVLAAAEDLVVLRLGGGALGVGAHIKGDRRLKAFGDQTGDTAENVFDNEIGLIDNADLDIGDAVTAEFLGAFKIFGLGVVIKELHQLFHDVVLDQSVDVEDDGFLA